MVIVIRGQRYWLWRAVDNEGEVLDFLRAIEAERPSSVEVDAQAAEETRLDTHPDYNR